MPAVYASGPALQWDGSGFMPEAEQVEPIFLNALEEAFAMRIIFPTIPRCSR